MILNGAAVTDSADVNGDGLVNASDINEIIKIIFAQ